MAGGNISQAQASKLLGQTETINTGAGMVKVSHDIFGNAKIEQGPIVSPYLSSPITIGDSMTGMMPKTIGGMGSVHIENTGALSSMSGLGLQNMIAMPLFNHGPLLEKTVQTTRQVPVKTFSQNVIAPAVDSHVVHGENTV